MAFSDFLKKNALVLRIGQTFNIYKEYLKDAHFFSKYYIGKYDTNNKREYKISFLVHSLEKGMCIATRPFGNDKIRELLVLLEKCSKSADFGFTTATRMGIEMLIKWSNLYEEKGWDNEFLSEIDYYKKKYNLGLACVGCKVLKRHELEVPEKCADFETFVSSRHSVRNFSYSSPLSEAEVEKAISIAKSAPSACNRQMVKVYWIQDNDVKKMLDKTIKGISGFDKETVNYFLITYDVNSLMFYGERDQGSFNAGLFAMTFEYALHSLSIGSCFMQWSNNVRETQKVKSSAGIPENEKIVCVLGAGHYADECEVPLSFRKRNDELIKVV